MYIYIGTNTVNSKQYVGQSINDPHKDRIKAHKLANGKTRLFHRAIRKYGFENFTWKVIHYPGASQEALNAIEQWQIAKRNTLSPDRYNLTTGGNQGGSPSSETRAKLSKALKGKPSHNKGRIHSAETRAKMSEARKGKPAPNKGKRLSAKHRAKMSKAHKGKTLSAEHRAKMSKANKGEKNPNYGKTPSAESRAKMSKAHKGEKNPNYGKTPSAESRANMSKAQRRRRHNPNQITISF